MIPLPFADDIRPLPPHAEITPGKTTLLKLLIMMN
jgi:hypothetical protein